MHVGPGREHHELEDGFRRSRQGHYMTRDGAARGEGAPRRSSHKLCLAATDRARLCALLRDLADDAACLFVKCAIRPRAGIYRGRAVFVDDARVGELWRELRGHPGVVCTVQDDDFTAPFRPSP